MKWFKNFWNSYARGEPSELLREWVYALREDIMYRFIYRFGRKIPIRDVFSFAEYRDSSHE